MYARSRCVLLVYVYVKMAASEGIIWSALRLSRTFATHGFD